jgi:quercetin dioxygenase-like cupin family protein
LRLVNLATCIANHLQQVTSADVGKTQAVQHLRQSCLLAESSEFRAPAHGYGALVERAASVGLGGPAREIVARLLAVQHVLPWIYHYPLREADPYLSERVAFAELIGPDGPLRAPGARVGFTVMAERTFYPPHAHPAVELYLVLAGHAEWQASNRMRIVPPGELVLHHSSETHAMHTADEPMLALWGWSGDLDAPAVYV